MKTRIGKYMALFGGVLLALTVGSFPAFALGHPGALLAFATTSAAFASPVKLLAIAGSVFAILQAVKAAWPALSGVWAFILNIALSALGVLITVKPEDFFSLSTLTTVAIAAIGAAGVHGTWRSITGPQTPTDKTVASKVSILLIASLLVPSVATTTGCSSDQMQASITVASQVATSAAQIIAPVNPQAAQLLAAVGKGISDAGVAFQDYENAEASLKDSKGAALRAALSAIQGNLATILGDVRVKNPQLVQYISVGVAVVNTTVVLILNLLNKSQPAPGPIVQSASAAALPVLPAKSANDLKKAWNNACKNGYPQAVLK